MGKDPCFRSVFKDPFSQYQYLFEYSPEALKKKKKVLDIFDMDKKCFMKINIESSSPELWIRILFKE